MYFSSFRAGTITDKLFIALHLIVPSYKAFIIDYHIANKDDFAPQRNSVAPQN
jgi:hypothetical protein